MKRIPRENLLCELRRLCHELGRSPTMKEMNERGAYSAPTYRNRFGSWREALALIGKAPVSDNRGATREELVEAMQELARQLGRTPTKVEMRERGEFSEKPYIRVFGSWGTAISAAELELGPRQRQQQNIDELTLLKEIRRLASELGRAPSAREMNCMGKYSVTAYSYRYGSWNAAVGEAGFEPLEKPVGEREWDRTANSHYIGKWKEIRTEAIQRDEEHCQDCGMVRGEHQEEYGRDLEVHHLTPVREFDDPEEADQLDNLVTLCAQCHGKRERDLLTNR